MSSPAVPEALHGDAPEATFTNRSHGGPRPCDDVRQPGDVVSKGPGRGGGIRRAAPSHLSGAHVVLEVRVPDRPGGLGSVASRIGAVGADITDVVVAGRDVGTAIDVFHLTLPRSDVDLMALLRTELAEVDGVAIQGWRTATCCRREDPASEAAAAR